MSSRLFALQKDAVSNYDLESHQGASAAGQRPGSFAAVGLRELGIQRLLLLTRGGRQVSESPCGRPLQDQANEAVAN